MSTAKSFDEIIKEGTNIIKNLKENEHFCFDGFDFHRENGVMKVTFSARRKDIEWVKKFMSFNNTSITRLCTFKYG